MSVTSFQTWSPRAHSRGYSSTRSRCRRGQKCSWIGGVPWAKADENRCAWPADLKRCMPRSRLRGGRMDTAARVIRDVQVRLDNVDVRLGAVEDRVLPGAAITDAQATDVSNQGGAPDRQGCQQKPLPGYLRRALPALRRFKLQADPPGEIPGGSGVSQ